MRAKIGKNQTLAKIACIDKIIIALAIFLMFFLRQDITLIFFFIFAFIYLHLSKRDKLIYTLGIAFSISLVWAIISKDEYHYINNFISVYKINIFPLLAWTLGLFALYLLYLDIIFYLKKPAFVKKFAIFIGLYWPLLIAAETIWRHFVGIININSYPGLPICNCLHAVWWMKISYFLIGIIFFIINYNIIEKQLK